MKIYIIFGPPGVGKGTQSELICKKAGVEHLSTGEALRKEVKNKSKIGLKVDKIIKSGNLVSDSIITKIVKNYLLISHKNGFLLDGFPRDLKQAKILLSWIKNKKDITIKVVNLNLKEEELIKRLIKRAKIEKRADDNLATIKKRINVYHKETLPIINFLKKKNIKIIDINADGNVFDIEKEILNKL